MILLPSRALTRVSVKSSTSNLKTARVLPVEPTSPESTHRAFSSVKSYDGITVTPLPRLLRNLRKNDGVDKRNDALAYWIVDNFESSFAAFDPPVASRINK